MNPLLIMLMAVICICTAMMSVLFFAPHWPTVAWTVVLIAGYALQITALWKAGKAQSEKPEE